MQGIRRGHVGSARPAQRARYCRRCGAPLAIAPSAMGGIRCSNCGFTPSITERTAAELGLPRPPAAQVATRFVAVPMAIESEPVATQTDPVAGQTDAIRSWLRDLASNGLARLRELASRGLAAWRELASRGLARWRDWVEELGPPTVRTWITTAAAGLAIAFAIAVVMTIG